ncbi:glycosyltransferase [Bordetella genomosp. 8]|uniref:Glycosyltransferase n=1 Tax=Bordetella genomosp. 8 TaxID=1416806 RepID=A0A1W6YSY7_9BORD|nr:glycosyltransferase family 2 protein [Bordetella genomosp. 8]ARP84094.1 glycosyltransferase [Bordetella genomosp. 8]
MYSVIIPVYRNAEFIPDLISEFSRISAIVAERFGLVTEFIFVVDHSPDNSYDLLRDALPDAPFPSQLVLHARNFGSFAAIRTGLQAARGDYVGVIAADLQEPPELLVEFLAALVSQQHDIVIGVREAREDPPMSRFASNMFWDFYRRWIVKEIPEGGVDVFGANRRVRDELLKLEESHSSLVGLLFWIGFRRHQITYGRRKRMYGKSAWTLSKKINYLMDSIFAFTDLPIRLMTILGFAGTAVALVMGIVVTLLKLVGDLPVPGYAATIVLIGFFGALNTLGLGLVGAYAWRAYENTKRRPLAVIQGCRSYEGSEPRAAFTPNPSASTAISESTS